MHVDDLLARLEGVTGDNGQWYAKCPAHDDRHASLSVALGRDGRILLSCHKEPPCELEAIAHGVHVAVRDLFVSNGELELKPREHFNGKALARALHPTLPDEADVQRRAELLLRSQPTLDAIYELKGWRAGALAALEVGLPARARRRASSG
jgi:hypothetical protein